MPDALDGSDAPRKKDYEVFEEVALDWMGGEPEQQKAAAKIMILANVLRLRRLSNYPKEYIEQQLREFNGTPAKVYRAVPSSGYISERDERGYTFSQPHDQHRPFIPGQD